MKSLPSLLFIFILILTFQACKNEKSTDTSITPTETGTKTLNDSKALEGTGVKDVSHIFQLDQAQVVQPGNVGFNFKTHNAFRVYLNTFGNDTIDFAANQTYAIFADETVKETSFIVENFDKSGEQPVLSVKTVISTKDVPKYRPSFVVTVPRSVEGFPIIKVDGAQIPVFIIE
ncbi:MAG TPA: hypothetical protein PK611_09910 [Saprospiraceae bacterium]|nr:hypothetical protein [Saprospiraceae bacterium]HRO09098.1 hypothetical protein [Saprospiraceae bacterium]HRO73973.1 hypothetical protein [Saprospiraceae bacterium]HRP42445.1 hypothetical protein [Saprospiraceae bacterium]